MDEHATIADAPAARSLPAMALPPGVVAARLGKLVFDDVHFAYPDGRPG